MAGSIGCSSAVSTGCCRLRAGPESRAAAPVHHADGHAGHHRGHRLSLLRDPEGLLSAAGHRDDPRHRRGGAGYFVPRHGAAHGGRGRMSCSRIRRSPRSAIRSGRAGRPPRSIRGACSSRSSRKNQRNASADEVIRRLQRNSPRSRASRSTCRRRRTSPSARA